MSTALEKVDKFIRIINIKPVEDAYATVTRSVGKVFDRLSCFELALSLVECAQVLQRCTQSRAVTI